jgi:hypothetical protein
MFDQPLRVCPFFGRDLVATQLQAVDEKNGMALFESGPIVAIISINLRQIVDG